ncbi:MAG: cation diffusion facilitator family transporter [Clostridia bacterium]|nr:cation diffusion facilitator family transporter [Clostridia bacterium]
MQEKNKEVKKISIVGIIFNFLLLIIKLIVGILSNSQSMIADGLNSAGDIFASLMSYVGNKISAKPIDREHPYGHGKAEYIFSWIISISMIMAALAMMNSSIQSIINNGELHFSYYLIIVCCITIITKVLLYIYAKSKYSKNKSILIKASMEDHRNDIFVTTGTLLGILASSLGFYYIDGIVGTLISLWIGYAGIRLFKSSYDVLMDTDIEEERKNAIYKELNECENILHVDSLNSKPVGDKYIIILKISMNGNLTLNESHRIAGVLKEQLLNKFDYIYDIIIHINPH